MRNLVIFAFTFAAIAFAVDSATKGIDAKIECVNGARQPKLYENKIKQAILKAMEKFRNEGIPSLNISSLDPLVLQNLDFGINQALAKLHFNISEGQLTGQTYFDITNLTFSLIGLKFTYGFSWSNIHGKGKSSLDGLLAGIVNVFGNGDFDVEAKIFAVAGTGKLGSDENKFLFLEQFTTDITLNEFKAEFTGLMNNPELSDLVSKLLTDILPALFKKLHGTVGMLVSKKVIQVVNQLLVNVTIGDIIGGLGRDYIHCGDAIEQILLS